MILDNYYKATGYFTSHVNVPDNSYSYGFPQVNLGMVDMSGNAVGDLPTATTSTISYIEACNCNYSAKVDIDVIVGTGSTAPTLSDYALDSDVTAQFSNYTATWSFSSESGQSVSVATISGVNNTANPITIREIGVMKYYYPGTTSASRDKNGVNTRKVLLVRHLLETPKTVTVGEGFSITFKWTES